MRADGWATEVKQDRRMRASAIVGVFEGLHLYPGDDLADRCVRMPNRSPVSATPIGPMLENGLPGILEARPLSMR